MANVDNPNLAYQIPYRHAHGNKHTEHFWMSNTTATNGDVYRLGVIPKGTKLIPGGLLAVVADMDASTTLSFGIAAKNSGAQGDADYYAAAKAVATGPTLFGQADANKAVTPLVLDDDYYLIATLGGANQTADARIDAFVDFLYPGLG